MTPDAPQKPETAKGEIRKRMEDDLRQAAEQHGFKTHILRGGDFYGPGSEGSWFDLGIAMNFKKNVKSHNPVMEKPSIRGPICQILAAPLRRSHPNAMN